MKIGFATINEPQHEVAKRIASDIDTRTRGRIKARVFPASQIGSIPQMIEGLQLGTTEVLIVPPAFLVGLNPAFQVIDAPGLFDSPAHAHRAITDAPFRDRYLGLATAKGLTGVMLYMYDTTSLATLTPIRKPDDLKGKKIRVLATQMERELMSSVGATGVPITFSEVMMALSNRSVDGVRSNITAMGGSKFFTVTKFITMEASGAIPSAVFLSTLWLDKLPSELRKAVSDLPKELEPWAAETAISSARGSEKLWTENGAEVIRFSTADQRAFMEKVRPLGDRILGNDPATQEMYALLKQSVARTR